MSKDTAGNVLLSGDETDMHRDRSDMSTSPSHFKRDPTAPFSGNTTDTDGEQRGGSRRRRRRTPKSSRKFKKSSKRVFRKKSRATRRR